MEVEPTGQRDHMAIKMAETATKSLPVPLQKHLLGGCTIDILLSNCHQRGYRFPVQYFVIAFRALMLLDGQQEGHTDCKKLDWRNSGMVICLGEGGGKCT